MSKPKLLKIVANAKLTFSGHCINLTSRYKIELHILKPLYDLHEKADFAGWISYQNGKNKWFHNFAKKFSRFQHADLFSLIAVINGKKIDLGKLWKQAGKQSFTLDFSDYFSDDFSDSSSKEKVYVFLNDVHGFYWNNRGSYTIDFIPCT